MKTRGTSVFLSFYISIYSSISSHYKIKLAESRPALSGSLQVESVSSLRADPPSYICCPHRYLSTMHLFLATTLKLFPCFSFKCFVSLFSLSTPVLHKLYITTISSPTGGGKEKKGSWIPGSQHFAGLDLTVILYQK